MQRNGNAKVVCRGEEHAYQKCAQGTRAGIRNEQGGVRTEVLIDTKIKNCLSFQLSDADVLRNNLVMAAAHVCATTTPRARAPYNEDSLRKLINGQSVGRTLPRFP